MGKWNFGLSLPRLKTKSVGNVVSMSMFRTGNLVVGFTPRRQAKRWPIRYSKKVPGVF